MLHAYSLVANSEIPQKDELKVKNKRVQKSIIMIVLKIYVYNEEVRNETKIIHLPL